MNQRRNKLIDLVQIMIPHLTDLRDFAYYQAYIVLDGMAVLIQQPSVPSFLLLEEKQFLFQHEKIVPGCSNFTQLP